jgi:hypothetical protein
MMSAEASASAIALARPTRKDGTRSGLRADLPFSVGDRWTGSYDCSSGGKTELDLTFDELRPGEGPDEVEVDVLVELRSAAGPGRAALHGNYRAASRRLRLDVQEWLVPLPSSHLVDLAGTVQASGTYSGRADPGCGSFTAAPAAQKAHRPDGRR